MVIFLGQIDSQINVVDYQLATSIPHHQWLTTSFALHIDTINALRPKVITSVLALLIRRRFTANFGSIGPL
jgi:hypothetical protein